MTILIRAEDYTSPEEFGISCRDWRTTPLDGRIARLRRVRFDLTDLELVAIANRFDRACVETRAGGQVNGYPSDVRPIRPSAPWLPSIPQGADPFHPVQMSPIAPLFPATYPYFGSGWPRIRPEWWPFLMRDFPNNWPVNWPFPDGRGGWVLREGPIAGTAMRTTQLQNRPGLMTPAAYRTAVP